MSLKFGNDTSKVKLEELGAKWEKHHFIVENSIVLGHVILKKGIEVDKVNIKLIVNLPIPTNVKEVKQPIGHASMLIKDLSKLTMYALLSKDT